MTRRPDRRRGWTAALIAAALLALGDVAGADTRAEETGTGGVNAERHRDAPVVILVSVDGYRWDFPERFPTPGIRRLIASGERAERLVPVWPTLTFPNHYSLVTGLAPADHGIVGNEFPDPGRDRWYALGDRDAVEDGSFYGGEPIWVTAERQGMVTASFFWVGSEAAVQGLRPTHWYPYDKDIPAEARVNQVLAWLDAPPDTRPHFITLYFEQVDDSAHWYGLGTPEFRAALATVDRALERLLDGVDALPGEREVYLVLVSDHGQMGYGDGEPFVLADHLYLDGLALIDKGPAVYAWQGRRDAAAAAKLAETVNAVWAHGRAYTRATAPAAWGLADNERFPDLVFQADPGHAVLSRRERARTLTAGDHGWAPDTPEMHGIFVARGPGLAPGSRRPALPVTAVRDQVLDWLGIAQAEAEAEAEAEP